LLHHIRKAVIEVKLDKKLNNYKVIQCVKNLAEFYFVVDCQPTKLGGDYGTPHFFRLTHNRRRIRQLEAAEGSIANAKKVKYLDINNLLEATEHLNILSIKTSYVKFY